MPHLNYLLNLPAPHDQLMNLTMDFQNLPTYLPDQLKSVKIIEQRDNETITEEKIFFSSIFKKNIVQQSLHRKIGDNQLQTQIISGPAKGTIIDIVYKKNVAGTQISIDVDLQLTFKAKFLQPLIKKMYKNILTGILYKMNNKILLSTEN